MSDSNKKILFAIPHTGMFPALTVNAILAMIGSTLQLKNTEVAFQLVGHSLVYDARNQMADFAVKEGFTHVLFLDSDMVPPRDMLNRLLAHDKDIVSGMAFKRVAPFQPCFYKESRVTEDNKLEYQVWEEWPDNTLIDCVGVGMACTLIKVDVFKAVKEKFGLPFMPDGECGEDLAFCNKARELGYKVLVDTSLCVGHLGTFEITQAHWRKVYADNSGNVSQE